MVNHKSFDVQSHNRLWQETPKALPEFRVSGDHRKRPFPQVVLDLLQKSNPNLRVHALLQRDLVYNVAHLMVLFHHLSDLVSKASIFAPQLVVYPALTQEVPSQTAKLRLLPVEQRVNQLSSEQVAVLNVETLRLLQGRKQLQRLDYRPGMIESLGDERLLARDVPDSPLDLSLCPIELSLKFSRAFHLRAPRN